MMTCTTLCLFYSYLPPGSAVADLAPFPVHVKACYVNGEDGVGTSTITRTIPLPLLTSHRFPHRLAAGVLEQIAEPRTIHPLSGAMSSLGRAGPSRPNGIPTPARRLSNPSELQYIDQPLHPVNAFIKHGKYVALGGAGCWWTDLFPVAADIRNGQGGWARNVLRLGIGLHGLTVVSPPSTASSVGVMRRRRDAHASLYSCISSCFSRGSGVTSHMYVQHPSPVSRIDRMGAS